jgi:hypothetical protein
MADCLIYIYILLTIPKQLNPIEIEIFWQCRLTLRITGFLDFVHRPEF